MCNCLGRRTKVSRIGLAGATDVFREHPDDDALWSPGLALFSGLRGFGFGGVRFTGLGFKVKGCAVQGLRGFKV